MGDGRTSLERRPIDSHRRADREESTDPRRVVDLAAAPMAVPSKRGAGVRAGGIRAVVAADSIETTGVGR